MSDVQCPKKIDPALDLAGRVTRDQFLVLQLNIGRTCNLSCTHCHVEAGPKRTEVMTPAVRERVIAWIREHRPATVDITGGAPELIPGFRDLVDAAHAASCQVMDRCNLAVLDEPGQEDLADFLAERRVAVVASLPCYVAENVDRQRGKGAYDRSITGLIKLNSKGYGRRAELPLYLVYNPTGPSLPPYQGDLEPAYRKRLADDWGIDFTNLWCLANVPVTRFRRFLERSGALESYEELLRSAYNPNTLPNLMCRSTLSVDHEGRLYDCDFNLAIGLALPGPPRKLWDMVPDDLNGAVVATGSHCFACTAGKGSSCGGALS